MITKFDLSTMDIPYGVLHDECLKHVRRENNQMILTFDISEHESKSEFNQIFAKYKHCEMIITMTDDALNTYILQTAINGNGEFKGKSISETEFITAINNAAATFIGCTASELKLCIELNACFKNKKYRQYCSCFIELEADNVKWKWS